MIIAFHGFQKVPKVGVLDSTSGWRGFLPAWAEPLAERGFLNHHLHNPFGLHDDLTDPKRKMHIDQFERSCRAKLSWLANAEEFKAVVDAVHGAGGTVAAYVGSPLVFRDSIAGADLPRCAEGAAALAMRLRIRRTFGLCGDPFGRPCSCWTPLVRFHLAALRHARVDRIGFDWSSDFLPGSCMDQLVRSLVASRIEVMIEDWPFKERAYPPVSWIVREVRYTQIRFGLVEKKAPADSVTTPIYRIAPSTDSDEGREEIDDINTLLESHGEARLDGVNPTQDVANRIQAAGHIALVRARQLRDEVVQ